MHDCVLSEVTRSRPSARDRDGEHHERELPALLELGVGDAVTRRAAAWLLAVVLGGCGGDVGRETTLQRDDGLVRQDGTLTDPAGAVRLWLVLRA